MTSRTPKLRCLPFSGIATAQASAPYPSEELQD
jgi:hypothetical protein